MIISPEDFSNAAIVTHEVAEGLLTRLEWMTLQPKVILNLGCKTGHLTQALQEKYSYAQIISIDCDYELLQYASQHTASDVYLCAPSHALPIGMHTVDLVVANLLLPWCNNASNWLREIKRVLRQDGLLILTTFGPDSFVGFDTTIVSHEMHELGDAIIQAGLVDPVLDTEYYTFRYKEKQKLIYELTASSIITNQAFALEELKFSCEVVFAHAFAGTEQLTTVKDHDGSARFPLSYLRAQMREQKKK